MCCVIPAFAEGETPAPTINISQLNLITETKTGGCSGDDFQVQTSEDSRLQMQAVYVQTCPAGQYFKVNGLGDTEDIIGANGVINGTECVPCSEKYYCEGVPSIVIDNNIISSQGDKEHQCPTTYEYSDIVTETINDTTITRGARTINDCYTKCSETTPVCAVNATDCGFTEQYSANDAKAYYGTFCETTFTTCNPGYNAESISAWWNSNATTVQATLLVAEVTRNVDSKTWKQPIAHNAASISSVGGIYECSNKQENGTIDDNDSGSYCWVKPTNFVSGNATSPRTVYINVDPVFIKKFGTAENCNTECGNFEDKSKINGMIAALNTTKVCVANIVNMTWDTGTGGDPYNNTCIYGGDLNIPTDKPVLDDKHDFIGWIIGSVVSTTNPDNNSNPDNTGN